MAALRPTFKLGALALSPLAKRCGFVAGEWVSQVRGVASFLNPGAFCMAGE